MILLILDGQHLVTSASMKANFWGARTIEILLEFGEQMYRYLQSSFSYFVFPLFLISFELRVKILSVLNFLLKSIVCTRLSMSSHMGETTILRRNLISREVIHQRKQGAA